MLHSRKGWGGGGWGIKGKYGKTYREGGEGGGEGEWDTQQGGMGGEERMVQSSM